jgi:hypothetical protein
MAKLKTGRFDTREELVRRVVAFSKNLSNSQIARNVGVSETTVATLINASIDMVKAPVIRASHVHAYEFQGWVFEYYRSKPISPWPLKKNLEPKLKAGRQFYRVLAEFKNLALQDQEQFRIQNR